MPSLHLAKLANFYNSDFFLSTLLVYAVLYIFYAAVAIFQSTMLKKNIKQGIVIYHLVKKIYTKYKKNIFSNIFGSCEFSHS